MGMEILDQISREGLRTDLPKFDAGDTVKVMVRVREGEKERLQAFEGVCIAKKGGGINETFTVRKISAGVGVERVFPLYSPTVADARGGAPWPRPPRQAVLPARAVGQGGPDPREGLTPCRSAPHRMAGRADRHRDSSRPALPSVTANSFYWHDYETWGTDPRRDRPAQFAGQRTDANLNPVGEPLVLYCRPADDCLPQPEACLITGITPAPPPAGCRNPTSPPP